MSFSNLLTKTNFFTVLERKFKSERSSGDSLRWQRYVHVYVPTWMCSCDRLAVRLCSFGRIFDINITNASNRSRLYLVFLVGSIQFASFFLRIYFRKKKFFSKVCDVGHYLFIYFQMKKLMMKSHFFILQEEKVVQEMLSAREFHRY